MKRIFTQFALLVSMAGFLMLPSVWAATPKDTLIVARNLSTFLSMDPQEAFEISSGNTLNALYLRLVQHDPTDFNQIIPGVAKSWDQDSNGKQITFQIRDDLVFQSGNPVTAEDAEFSLQRGILMDKQAAIILRQLGWNKDNVKQHVRADGNQLVLTFDEPYAIDLVLSALSAAIGSVVDKKVVLANEKDGDMGNGWLRTNSAGAGAYRLVEWKPKEVAVLEAFADYKGGTAPKLKRVIIRHVGEASAQRLLLEKGDVDVAYDLNADQIKGLADNSNVDVIQIPRGTIHYLVLNTANPQLAKPEVWKAFRWLIDYEGITDHLFHGMYKNNQSPLAGGVAGALSEQPYKLDVEKAKGLLAEAGVPNGFSVSMDVLGVTPYSEVSQALQASFAEAGIQVDLKAGESSQVLTRYRERRYDMLVFVWAPDISDPSLTMEFFSRNSDNEDSATNKNAAWRAGWLTPELTAQADLAAHEVDNDRRLQIYGEMQQKLRDESPFVFITQQLEAIAVRSNVKNYVGGITFDSTPFHIIEKQ